MLNICNHYHHKDENLKESIIDLFFHCRLYHDMPYLAPTEIAGYLEVSRQLVWSHLQPLVDNKILKKENKKYFITDEFLDTFSKLSELFVDDFMPSSYFLHHIFRIADNMSND